MSLLSIPTFRRLVETELMSFSESQDLKSFTAKDAETPEQTHGDVSAVVNRPARNKLSPNNAQTPRDERKDFLEKIQIK